MRSNSARCGHVRYSSSRAVTARLIRRPIVSGSLLRYRPSVFGGELQRHVIAYSKASMAPV
jgi:hypothetical protein